MPISTILVYEKKARWRPGLQREISPELVSIRACGSINDLRTATLEAQQREMPCLAILDLSSNLSTALQFLNWTHESTAVVPVILIGSPAHSVLEPTLRELGASAFHVSPVRRDLLAAECLRLLQLKQQPVARYAP